MDLQQPLSWFADKPLPGNGPPEDGHRRYCTHHETENGRVSSTTAPRLKWGGLPLQGQHGF
jgi:hypothetical protein